MADRVTGQPNAGAFLNFVGGAGDPGPASQRPPDKEVIRSPNKYQERRVVYDDRKGDYRDQPVYDDRGDMKKEIDRLTADNRAMNKEIERLRRDLEDARRNGGGRDDGRLRAEISRLEDFIRSQQSARRATVREARATAMRAAQSHTRPLARALCRPLRQRTAQPH